MFKRTSNYLNSNSHAWLEKGDMLITRSNSPELVGHVAIYNGEPSPCIYPDLMMRLRFQEGIIEQEFVHWWLRSPNIRTYITTNAKGTSPSMKKISQSIVMNIPFPSSLSRQEQQELVKRLNAMQEKVEALRREQAESAKELDSLLPAILDRAFRGQL